MLARAEEQLWAIRCREEAYKQQRGTSAFTIQYKTNDASALLFGRLPYFVA
jgi:hypothetical protein